MPIRNPKPTTPAQRFATYADFAEVTKTHHAMVDGLASMDAGALMLDVTPAAILRSS